MNFTISNVLRSAWGAYSRDRVFLTATSLLVVVVTIIANWLTNLISVHVFGILGLILSLATFVLTLLMQVGFMRITLLSYDSKPRTLRELFTHFRWVAPFLFTLLIVYGLIFILLPIVFNVLQTQSAHPIFTIISLIGPIGAVYIILRYYFAPILVVDENIRPIAALKRSAVLGAGHRMRIFGLGVIAIALLFAIFQFFATLSPDAFTESLTSETPTLFLVLFQLTTALFLPFFAMMTVASLRLLQAAHGAISSDSDGAPQAGSAASDTSKQADPNDPSNGAYA